jgi:circadian clock protein KaiB
LKKKNEISERYLLRLFITGLTPNSVRALVNVKIVCEQYLPDNCDLEVIDIYQKPEQAELENILATPMLIKKMPLPERRLIGDLTDIKSILKGLDLHPDGAGGTAEKSGEGNRSK